MPEPRWRRRKAERPGDIAAAALAVFAEKGFAGARIEEIARRAGLSKGAVYLYYPTKEDLFRAVVETAVAPNLELIERLVSVDMPFAERLRLLLPRFAEIVTTLPVGAVAKMVIGESRNFPELAKVWYDNVVSRAVAILTRLIEQAQARGEVREGDPRTHAFSIIGPMMLGILWRETFTPVGGAAIDLPAIARQHVETAIAGLAARKADA
jgi:AcrR family transcriptional regulator